MSLEILIPKWIKPTEPWKYTAFVQSQVSFHTYVWGCARMHNTCTQTGILIKMWTLHLSHKPLLSWYTWYPDSQLWQKNLAANQFRILYSTVGCFTLDNVTCSAGETTTHIRRNSQQQKGTQTNFFQIQFHCYYLMLALPRCRISTTGRN